MPEFSLIARSVAQLEADQAERRDLLPAEAWATAERRPDRVRRRLERALADYWYFKRIYFAPDQYIGGYAAPASFHRSLVRIMASPGVQVVAGPRLHAKTVESKQYAAWRLLAGRDMITGTLASTLPKSSNILTDIAAILEENPRIENDFRIEFKVSNSEQIQMRTRADGTRRHWRYMEAFSEGKSIRGFSRMFGRPSWILGDDIETSVSSMGEEQVRDRLRFVSESFSSLAIGGTLIWLGNNLDVRCAINCLVREQEQGILPDHWHVHRFRAWTVKGPLWKERFPATTEAGLRAMLKPRDEADWAANFQQDPIPPEGIVFRRENYRQWTTVPPDARGVIYCDQNLALKGLGDTTAIVRLVYSPSTNAYYVVRYRCLSYADPTTLLRDALTMQDETVFRLGFDGHVTQESTWTAHIRNWCRIARQPFPHVVFCRYNVDLCATNLQAIYAEGRLSFPPGMAETEEGSRALTQLFAFRGKKAKRLDDFPDSLICANELLHESGFVRAPNADGLAGWSSTVTDHRLF